MLPADLFFQSLLAIKSQPLRTALIVLAMSIGVASVSVLVALGDSARRYIVHEFEALGTHLVIVLPGRNETTGGPPPLFGETPRDLTLGDARALSASPHIAAIAPLMIGAAPVSSQGLERETNIFGSTRELFGARHLHMAQGGFLPKIPADQARSVCVIGQTIRKELFPNRQAIGQWLRINDRRFRVIGVLAPEGESIGTDFDEMVIVPVASGQALFDTEALFRILVEAKSKQAMPKAVDDIRKIIKARHEGEEDITIITQDSVVGTFDKILAALTLTVASIAAISLAVAGVLVMNVMLVSVTQRTAEIGLLKALGATRRQLHMLFLAEAALLSLAGAAAGALLGQLALAGLQLAYPKFPLALPPWAFLAALGVALLTGLTFGLLPARKAARLNPITALAKR
ncbi:MULTISPECIES: ABC transporter permease [Methylomicrobium]|uniref:ABC-type antimicrobial peptide transport system, permease component n=1 Tax=Methylomicrobium album BG8 TaxID=686340 RepID=H8GH32_METAL|nr:MULTISPECIES: ABC transporter permease [Methylomicrobium]EIC31307.1 ABC-type antimicrobial peptide transport system, permease component [Methylomicrobium album BG8]